MRELRGRAEIARRPSTSSICRSPAFASGEYSVELTAKSPAGEAKDRARVPRHATERSVDAATAHYAYMPRMRVTVATRLMATM